MKTTNKRFNPCTVEWMTPKDLKSRYFADKVEASRWVVKRQDGDPRFSFYRMSGDTWVVYNMDTIRNWANGLNV